MDELIQEKIKMLGKVDIFDFEEGLDTGLDDKELALKHNLSTKDVEHLKREIWY